MADQRNPPGRRPPVLPLPPPKLDDHDDGSPRFARRAPTTDATGELPRLPEVGVHDDSKQVRIDPRALSPNQRSIQAARAMAADQPRSRPTHHPR